MANADLSQVYNRLNGVAQYHPFTATTFADWASEAGDTVTISRDGTSYSSPVHKQSLVWRGKHEISMESTGTRERTAIERVSNVKETTTSSGVSSSRSYGGGAGSAVKALQYDFYSEDGMYQSQMYMDEQRFTTIFAKTGINELGHDETLTTMINQNAEQITLEAQRAATAEGVLQGRLTVEADRITEEVTRATAQEGILVGRLTVEADRITQEVGRATAQEGLLRGAITTEADRITAEVTRASAAEGVLDGKITVEAGKISQIVTAVGTDGQVTAASIVLAINESTGSSEAKIDAEHVYIGNTKSTTVIAGKLEASDITADFLSAKIATIPTLRGIAASFSGNVSTTSGVIAYQVYADGNNISNPAVATRITGPSSNVYTMQYQTADGTWHDAGTFSRATSLSGAWSGTSSAGKSYKVTASPQGNTNTSPSVNTLSKSGDPSWASNEKSFTQNILVQDSEGESIYLGSLSFSGFTKGDFTAVQVSPVDFSKYIRVDSTAVTLYNAGTTTFYARGDSLTGREVLSSGGTFYYPADTAKTYYKAGTTTVTGRGNTVSAREVLSSGGTTYYKALVGEDYYVGNGGEFTPQGSYCAQLRNIGTKTLYDEDGHSQGYHDWWYASSAGSYLYYAGSGTKYDRGDKVTINEIDRNNKVILGPVTTYYKGDGGGSVVQGEAVTVTPIKSTSGIRLGASNTYYKGNGGLKTVQGTTQDAYKKLSSGGTLYYENKGSQQYYTKA